jgi:zinc protease
MRALMPRATFLSLGLALALATPANAAPPADEPAPAAAETADDAPIFPYERLSKTLDNGLTVVVVPMKGTDIVSVRTVVRTGSRDEYEKGRTGFAHFFEHMMFRGTKKYPQDKREEIVTRMGADGNAYTSDDVTVYQLDFTAEDLETVMDVESDRFMNLDYPKPAFQTEAGAVYGEFRKNRASPWFQMNEAVSKTAFTKHTYGHTTMGYEKDIAAMPKMYDYSRKFFERYYRPENVALVIAGAVEADPVFTLVEKYWGPWERGYKAPKIKKEPEQKKERRVDVSYEGRALPMLSIGYKAPAFDPDDKMAVAQMLLAELAFGETSDIHRDLVLEQRVVQGMGASPAMSRDPGLWSIDAMIADPSKVDAVLAAVDATIAKFRDESPDPKQLERLKSRQRYGYLMQLDTSASVAGTVARLYGVTGIVDADERMVRTLAKITPDDVREAARALFVDTRRTVGVLTPVPPGSSKPDDAKGKKAKAKAKAKKGAN